MEKERIDREEFEALFEKKALDENSNASAEEMTTEE